MGPSFGEISESDIDRGVKCRLITCTFLYRSSLFGEHTNYMTWEKVVTLAILVAGAVVASALGNKDLGLALAGAAAGFATQNGGRSLPPSDRQQPEK